MQYNYTIVYYIQYTLLGLLEAFEYQNECIQPESYRNTTNDGESENCLYLNVWRPRPVQQNRAVMVYWANFMETPK